MADDIVLQNEIPEQPLPEGISYDTLVNKPQSLADISITDALALNTAAAQASAAAIGLGDLAIMGWQFTGTFSATGQASVAWTGGTLTFKDGTSFTISSGSVAGISTSVPTYIYFSKVDSTTILQATTVAANAVGANKVLIAVCQGNSASGKKATFQVFGGTGGLGTFITADNIAANSITANEIAANTITAAQLSTSLLYAGSITIDTNGSIKGGMSGYNNGAGFFLGMSGGQYKMSVGNSAGNKMLWDGSALTITGSITGSTITGSTLSTATSGQRVVLTSTLAQFYNSSGVEIVDTYADSNSYLIKGMQSASSIVLDTGATGQVVFKYNNNSVMAFDGANFTLAPTTDAAADLGKSTFRWGRIFVFQHYYGGDNIIQPLIYTGLVNGTSISQSNTVGWSVSQPATGRYTITHNLGNTNYNEQITVRASAAKLWSVESHSSNSFTIRIANFSGTLEDNLFAFQVALNM